MYEKLHIDFLVSTSVNIGNEDCKSLWVELKLSHKQCAVCVAYRHLSPDIKAL